MHHRKHMHKLRVTASGQDWEPQTWMLHMILPRPKGEHTAPATTAERIRAVRRDGRAFQPVVSEYISTLLCAFSDVLSVAHVVVVVVVVLEPWITVH